MTAEDDATDRTADGDGASADGGAETSGADDAADADGAGTADGVGGGEASPPSGDELAGIVDLFGALTRPELRRACAELAFKRGATVDGAALDRAVEAALDGYVLVRADPDAVGGTDAPALLVGPTAFPALPPRAEDLPHIMDVPDRAVDRAAAADATRARLEAAAGDAAESGDCARARALLDVCYDFEAWAGPDVDAGAARERLDRVLQD